MAGDEVQADDGSFGIDMYEAGKFFTRMSVSWKAGYMSYNSFRYGIQDWFEFAPSILLVVLDDAGYHDMGDFEKRAPHRCSAPVVSQLMDSGIRLKNYYVMPICSPTRAAMMSGRHPIRYGGQTGTADGPFGARSWLPTPVELGPLAGRGEGWRGAGAHRRRGRERGLLRDDLAGCRGASLREQRRRLPILLLPRGAPADGR